jgi:hypothetical protein
VAGSHLYGRLFTGDTVRVRLPRYAGRRALPRSGIQEGQDGELSSADGARSSFMKMRGRRAGAPVLILRSRRLMAIAAHATRRNDGATAASVAPWKVRGGPGRPVCPLYAAGDLATNRIDGTLMRF